MCLHVRIHLIHQRLRETVTTRSRQASIKPTINMIDPPSYIHIVHTSYTWPVCSVLFCWSASERSPLRGPRPSPPTPSTLARPVGISNTFMCRFTSTCPSSQFILSLSLLFAVLLFLPSLSLTTSIPSHPLLAILLFHRTNMRTR